MSKTTSTIYEEWDLSPVQTPVRSTLYGLEPIGLETPWVESLTSYMIRLAQAHCVFPGIFLDKLIAPLVQEISYKTTRPAFTRGDGDRSNLISAPGVRAAAAVEVLRLLTRRTDLSYLTLLPLQEVLLIRGLIRKSKAWCSSCYEEWRMNGQTIYDPLLWILLPVTHCIRHRQPLNDHCPNPSCSRPLPAMAWRSQPGYCPYCHFWLGRPPLNEGLSRVDVNDVETEWQRWVIENLGALLAAMSAISSPPTKLQITEKITYVVQQISAGNMGLFARSTGMNFSMIRHWCRFETLPQIDKILRFCFVLSLPLSDFLLNDVSTLHPQVKEVKWLTPLEPRKQEPVDRKYLSQALEQIFAVQEYPPPSLAEVGRRLGYPQVVLYTCNHPICHEISLKYMKYVREKRMERMQQYREEFQQVAIQLRAAGLSLNRSRVAPFLSQPGILRDPKVRTLLEEVLQELEKGKTKPLL